MASSSSTTVDDICPELEPRHKIFLSHSGHQKDFVEQLCVDLERVNHFPFFDKRPDSLPKGARYPPLIFQAARQCKLAVVLLSTEFVESKWPMTELVTFIDEADKESSSIQILPLFYKLSIEDCSNENNLAGWLEKWNELALKDRRFDAAKCKAALLKLCSWNGEKFDKRLGEVQYRERIVSSICRLIPPDHWVSQDLEGRERLCQMVVTHFAKAAPLYSSPGVPVLGWYGAGGIGKSTLCRAICSHFSREYSGKVCLVELPTEPTEDQVLKQLHLVLQKLSEAEKEVVRECSTIEQANEQLNNRIRSRKVFLAIDNVWDNETSMEGARAILDARFKEGSKVFVTARTEAVLGKLLGKRSSRVAAPRLREDEALNILLAKAAPVCKLSELTNAERGIFKKVVKHCRCHPLAVKTVGGIFSRLGRDTSGWEEEVKKLQEHEWGDGMSKLIERSYGKLSDELKQVFLDVAVFVPISLEREKTNAVQASGWLNVVYASSKTMDLLEELRKYALLDWVTPTDEIRIHDLFRDFALKNVSKSDESRCIYLEDTHDLPSELWVEDWGKVERIAVVGCGLESLGKMKLERSSELKSLCLTRCRELKELSLRGMASLRSLEIYECGSLSKLKGLSSLVSLRRLRVSGCRNLSDEVEESDERDWGKRFVSGAFRFVAGMLFGPDESMQGPPASGCSSLGIENLAKLQELRLEDLDLSKMSTEKMVDLRKLECRYCGVREITSLWSSLEELIIVNSNCSSYLSKGPELMILGKLRVLELCYCTTIAGLFDLSHFPKMESLSLRYCPNLTGVALEGSSRTALQALHLQSCELLEAIPDLGNLPKLSSLHLLGCRNVSGLSPQQLSAVHELDISDCPKLASVEAWLLVCVDENALDAPQLLRQAWECLTDTILDAMLSGQDLSLIFGEIAAAPPPLLHNIAQCILKRNGRADQYGKTFGAVLRTLFLVVWRKERQPDVVFAEKIAEAMGVELLLSQTQTALHYDAVDYMAGLVAALAATGKYWDAFLTHQTATTLLDAYPRGIRNGEWHYWASLPCLVWYMAENKEIAKHLQQNNAAALLIAIAEGLENEHPLLPTFHEAGIGIVPFAGASRRAASQSALVAWWTATATLRAASQSTPFVGAGSRPSSQSTTSLTCPSLKNLQRWRKLVGNRYIEKSFVMEAVKKLNAPCLESLLLRMS